MAAGFAAGATIGAGIVSLLPNFARSPQLAVAETEPGLHHYIPDQTDPRVVAIAKECRYYSPKFSPKAVPAFYDLSGLTENPHVFQSTMDVFIERYRAQTATGKGPTVIVGYDARGFVVGPPIALALGIPFVLLRKAGKNPGPLVRDTTGPLRLLHAATVPCLVTSNTGANWTLRMMCMRRLNHLLTRRSMLKSSLIECASDWALLFQETE